MSEFEWVYGWQEVMKSKKSPSLHWCFFGESSCLLHEWHTGATHMADVITDILRYRRACSEDLCLLSQSKDAVAAYRTTTYIVTYTQCIQTARDIPEGTSSLPPHGP